MKTKKNLGYYFLLLGIIFYLPINAQTSEVSGVVSDEAGLPLPGVSILIKNTTKGTATDFDGKYSINANANAILVFSYLGYKGKEVSVGGQTTLNVSLEEDTSQLDEVVVIGYGTVKKTDLTGAVSSMETETITERNINNPIEAIQGALPGVVITNNSGRLGDGFDVSIRGTNSFSGGNVLYIVDGVPTNGIDFLNPQDIERIDVLKDASSAAIYGSRGANGVIIVQTKSGASAQSGVNVSVESSFGITQIARMPHFMTGEEWWAYHQVAYLNQNDPLGDTPANNFALASNNSPELVRRANEGFSFDWADVVFKDGISQNNYIAINGRADGGLSYNLSLGLQNDKGLLDNESIDKYTVNAGINHNINDKFTTGINLTVAHQIDQLGSDRAMQEAVRLNPLTSPWAVDANGNQLVGELFYQPGKLTYPNGDWAFNKTSTLNPLFEIANSSQELRKWRTLGNIFLEYKPLSWLSFKTTFSAGLSTVRTGQAYGIQSSYGGESNGNNSSINNSENFNYTWDNQFNINYTFNEDHAFSFLGLQSIYSNRTETSFLSSILQPFETDWYNIGAGSSYLPRSGFSKNTLSSYAVRLNYVYKDKYLLTASNRWDGSSVLAEGNKWDFFPSVALGWKLSEEGFLTDNDVINNLKLRASIGYTGSDAVSPYSTLNGIPTQTFYDFNGSGANGFISNQVANRNLGWEKTRELNFGLDFGILSNRIYGSIDVYDRLSEDLIVEQTLPIESGAGNINNNVGSLSNKGVEISLVTRNIQTDKVSWQTTFTFTKNTNSLESVYGQSEVDDPGNGFFIGQPFQPHYNYVFDGIWQAEEAAEAASYGMKEGEARPKDINNDGVIDPNDDRVVLGTNDPDWSGSLVSNLKVGNFDLSVTVLTSQGVFVLSRFHDNFADTNDRGRQKIAFDSYYVPANGAGLPEQRSNTNPRPRGQGAFWGTNFAFYRDASFTKIKNINIGYSLNQDVLEKLKISNCRIYANILNPFVFTDYDGWDPEWAAAGLGTGRPSSVTYQLGVSLKF